MTRLDLQDLLASSEFHPAIYWIVILLAIPFFSFATCGLTGKLAPLWSSGLLGVNALIVVCLAFLHWNQPEILIKAPWFELGDVVFNYSFLIDRLTLVMLVVVNFISFLVHVFSVEYMRADRSKPRYFACLGLFTFSMLGIVLFHNLLFIFIFWELVGLSSYLLIGFWFEKKSASLAANKAFIMNRLGDAGFLTGLMILYAQFQTLDLRAVELLMGFSKIENGHWVVTYLNEGEVVRHALDSRWLSAAGIALFCGAAGKSAQFPLQVWLPDAMEGPTPVSALIHAATMVAAGIFMLARVFTLLDGQALEVVAIAGAVTAFMAAVAALSQFDIKKVLAYSTLSQLGYMTLAIGVGAYNAGLFHLVTHAFFKAGLFLTAGIIIYQLHKLETDKVKFDTQDMRVMGGLKKKLPRTFFCFLICALALAGLPGFSGFLSKDAILINLHAWSVEKGGGYYLLEWMAFGTVLLTAFYIMRVVFLVFTGAFRLPKLSHSPGIENGLKEANWFLTAPALVLSILSISLVFGITMEADHSWFYQALQTPVTEVPASFSAPSQAELLSTHGVGHKAMAALSIGLALAGLLMAWLLYRPNAKPAKSFAEKREPQSPLVQISFCHWYLDVLYRRVILRFVLAKAGLLVWFDEKILDGAVIFFAKFQVVLAHLVAIFDRFIIDGFVHLMAYTTGKVGQLTRSIQTGNVQTYILSAMAMLVLFLLWFAF